MVILIESGGQRRQMQLRARIPVRPIASGYRKLTKMLQDFFKQDQGARRWFLASESKQ
jgi:hypothetical protein